MTRWLRLSLLHVISLLVLVGCTETGGSSAVTSFMTTWVTSDANAAAGLMDQRAPESARDVVRSMTLKSWDGKISNVGDSTWTSARTGDQYEVTVYRVTPVVNFGGTFQPVTIDVWVAKDSGKVFLIHADI
jgi:hypothetical protein